MLLEDIPAMVRDELGISVNVNLFTHENKDYLEIVTLPCSFPVSYKGEYHYRSGSTRQVLKGVALTQFILQKTGITWDSTAIENLCIDDFLGESFDIFRQQALLSNRMDQKDLNISNAQLLDSLGLIKEGKILKAGMMLFYQKPERYVPGSYIKIGYFKSDSEISYMDEIHGPLIIQAARTIDLIFTKYLKANISYDGVTRIETYPFPKAAIREAVYNAIVHKNYAIQIPIQISVYKDKLYISNDCILPSGWTIETLMVKHRSKPFNPNIANVFFRAGFIETWGRGIEKICKACREFKTELPEFTLYPEEIMIKFNALKNSKLSCDLNDVINTDMNTDTNTDMNTDMNTDTNASSYLKEDQLLEYLKTHADATQNDMALHFNVTKRTIERNINTLKKENIIVRVGNNRKGVWKIVK